MEFSNTFAARANSVFCVNERTISNICLTRELSLESNNVFSRYLVTKLEGDEFEIPAIARQHIENIISNNMSRSSGAISVDTIVLPLYENSMPQRKKTFDSFIKLFFTETYYNTRLQKITSYSGEVYYGGKGLIFDDRYNPLMLCTLKAKKLKVDNKFRLSYFRPIIYINPIVFTEQNKLVNKGIIKKIIPYYSTIRISFPYASEAVFYNSTRVSGMDDKAIVIIDNFDRFFAKPTVPKPQSCTAESLNECLVNNVEDVLSLVI